MIVDAEGVSGHGAILPVISRARHRKSTFPDWEPLKIELEKGILVITVRQEPFSPQRACTSYELIPEPPKSEAVKLIAKEVHFCSKGAVTVHVSGGMRSLLAQEERQTRLSVEASETPSNASSVNAPR